MGSTPEAHSEDGETSVIHHLKRIEGQVRGLQQMIEHDRKLLDVIMQISSVRHSLESVAYRLLKQELENCTEAPGETSPDDLLKAVKMLSG